MASIPNNSQHLNQTRPHPPITDRSSPPQILTIDFRSERLRQRISSSPQDRIAIDIRWWGWAGSFDIDGIWR